MSKIKIVTITSGIVFDGDAYYKTILMPKLSFNRVNFSMRVVDAMNNEAEDLTITTHCKADGTEFLNVTEMFGYTKAICDSFKLGGVGTVTPPLEVPYIVVGNDVIFSKNLVASKITLEPSTLLLGNVDINSNNKGIGLRNIETDQRASMMFQKYSSAGHEPIYTEKLSPEFVGDVMSLYDAIQPIDNYEYIIRIPSTKKWVGLIIIPASSGIFTFSIYTENNILISLQKDYPVIGGIENTIRLKNDINLIQNQDLIIKLSGVLLKGSVVDNVPHGVMWIPYFKILEHTLEYIPVMTSGDPAIKRVSIDGVFWIKGDGTLVGDMKLEYVSGVVNFSILTPTGWGVMNPNRFREIIIQKTDSQQINQIGNYKLKIGENNQIHIDAYNAESNTFVTTFELGIETKTNNLTMYENGVFSLEQLLNDNSKYYAKICGSATSNNSLSYGDPNRSIILVGKDEFMYYLHGSEDPLMNNVITIKNEEANPNDYITQTISEYSFIADPVTSIISITSFMIKTLDPITDYILTSTDLSDGIIKYTSRALIEYSNNFLPESKPLGDVHFASKRPFYIVPLKQYMINIKFKNPVRVKGKIVNGVFAPYMLITHNILIRDRILTDAVVNEMTERIKTENNIWLKGEPNETNSVTLFVDANGKVDFRQLTDSVGGSIRASVVDLSIGTEFPSLKNTLQSIINGRVSKGIIDISSTPYTTLTGALVGWYWQVVVGGVLDGKTINIGDNVICNGNVIGLPTDLSHFSIEPAPIIAQMVGATSTNNGSGGTIPAPTAGQQKHVLHGNGEWEVPFVATTATDTNTGIGGVVPTPPSGTDWFFSNKLWSKIRTMVGATLTSNSTQGHFPVALIADRLRAAFGDGTWKEVIRPEVDNTFTGINSFIDTKFNIRGGTDDSKKVYLSVDNIPTNTTRTFLLPNKIDDQTFAMLGDLQIPSLTTAQRLSYTTPLPTKTTPVLVFDSTLNVYVVYRMITLTPNYAWFEYDGLDEFIFDGSFPTNPTNGLTTNTKNSSYTFVSVSSYWSRTGVVVTLPQVHAGKLTTKASTSTNNGANLSIPAGEKPTTLTNGDLYNDSVDIFAVGLYGERNITHPFYKSGYDLTTTSSQTKNIYRDTMLVGGLNNQIINVLNVPWIFDNIDKAEASLPYWLQKITTFFKNLENDIQTNNLIGAIPKFYTVPYCDWCVRPDGNVDMDNTLAVSTSSNYPIEYFELIVGKNTTGTEVYTMAFTLALVSSSSYGVTALHPFRMIYQNTRGMSSHNWSSTSVGNGVYNNVPKCTIRTTTWNPSSSSTSSFPLCFEPITLSFNR